jgi:glycosyltransferase involved in cell wall biosynthesis
MEMRIAHIVTRMNRGGCERNIASFAAWQLEHGHEVVVLAGPDPDRTMLPSGVRLEVVPDLVRPLAPRRDVRAVRELHDRLDTEGYEVVHTHQSKAGALGRLVPHPSDRVVIHTVHMPSFGPAYGPQSPVFRAAERWCAKRTDLIVTVGEELRALYLTAGIGDPSMYRVVRSPIELEDFSRLRMATTVQRRAARVALGVDPSLPTVLAVGTLEPRKRHGLVISSLRELLGTGSVQLLVAGDGPEKPALAQLAVQLGVERRTHLVGHLRDVTVAFQAADVLVHTSTTEGVPQVILQGLAAGLPVVATPVPGIAELGTTSIATVDVDEASLADGVQETLGHRPPPCDLQLLAAWHPAEVEEQIELLHRDIETLLREKRGGAAAPPRRRQPSAV